MSDNSINTVRRVMPANVWQGYGVSPMCAPRWRSGWERIGIDTICSQNVYQIRNSEIKNWIENQPVYMWKFYDLSEISLGTAGDNYLFTEEMEAWFTLRWS